MITFEKSSPVLNWLLEMLFQGFQISKIHGGACPQNPLATRSGARSPWFSHKSLATAMERRKLQKGVSYVRHAISLTAEWRDY